MTSAWTWNGPIDFVDHWQAILAGIVGFAAAVLVVWLTLRSEHRKREQEVEALRRSLGVEIRQVILSARSAHLAFRSMAQNRAVQITARMLESYAYPPEPIIYRACADKIGLLGQHAMEVVTIYRQAEI